MAQGQALALRRQHEISLSACANGVFRASPLLPHDVLFVGAAWPNRVRLLRSLIADLPGKRFKIGSIFGCEKPELPMPESACLWRASTVECTRLANRSRITLALHRNYTTNPQGQGLASTPPPRLFEAALAGTFQLYDASISETSEYLEPGKEVMAYTSYRDRVEKIQHYLSHPEERYALAAAAQSRALQSHTYQARVQQILLDLAKFPGQTARSVMTPSESGRQRLLFVTHNVLPAGHFGGVEVYQDGIAHKLSKTYDVLFYYRERRNGPNCYVLSDVNYKAIEDLQFDGDFSPCTERTDQGIRICIPAGEV